MAPGRGQRHRHALSIGSGDTEERVDLPGEGSPESLSPSGNTGSWAPGEVGQDSLSCGCNTPQGRGQVGLVLSLGPPCWERPGGPGSPSWATGGPLQQGHHDCPIKPPLCKQPPSLFTRLIFRGHWVPLGWGPGVVHGLSSDRERLRGPKGLPCVPLPLSLPSEAPDPALQPRVSTWSESRGAWRG